LAPADQKKRSEEYASRAVEMLTNAARAGSFADAGKIDHARQHRDLDPIRERADFRELPAKAEKQAKSPR
jgi:hypothetical protein